VRFRLPRYSTFLIRAAVWLLPLGVAVAATVLVGRARAEADLAQAADLLSRGELAPAEALLRRARGPAGRGGRAILEALRGGNPATDPTADIAPFRVRLLMEDALRRGDFEACRSLARFVRSLGQGDAASFLAAALVELGQDDEARAVARNEPALGASGLGREVLRILDLRAGGARRVVRDRRGRFLGTTDGTGVVTLQDDAVRLVPRPVLAAIPQESSAGLRLGVDLEASRLASRALGDRRGTIVLLDLRTGDLWAAVSDSRTQAEHGAPAWEQRREPASIAKLITTTAALRAGLDPDAEIARMTCDGHARYGDGLLWCAYPGGKLMGLGHALAISCNVAFANLGLKVGRAALVDEYRRFGFDLPAAEASGAGRIRQSVGNERQLADLAVGLEATDITPLHAARMAGVFAEGTLVAPRLIAASDGFVGLTPRARPASSGPRVLDPQWLPELVRAMEAVTGPGGTAAGLDPPSFPVAMKTGTAAQPHAGYHVNYVGVGPLPHPTIAFCVRVTHEPTSGHVTREARQVLATLLEGLGTHRR